MDHIQDKSEFHTNQVLPVIWSFGLAEVNESSVVGVIQSYVCMRVQQMEQDCQEWIQWGTMETE